MATTMNLEIIVFSRMSSACNVRTVVSEPSFFDETSVADDGDAWQFQLLLTELHQFADKPAFVWHERLSATEINLHHSYHNNNNDVKDTYCSDFTSELESPHSMLCCDPFATFSSGDREL